MKIAYVITRCDDLGGAQVHVRDLALAVKKKGGQAFVLGGSRGVMSEQLAEKGIPFIELRSLQRSILPFRDLAAVSELRSKLRDLQPDLVAAHSSKAGVVARIATSTLAIPTLLTVHGWAFTDGVPRWKRQLYLMIEKRAARFATRIITVSEYDRRIALESGVASESKITAIHNGMETIDPLYQAHPEAQPPVFLTIARHDRQKDYATLLEAFASVSRRHPDWKLVCVGAGPDLEKNRERVERLGLSPSVSILGFRNQPIELLAQASCFLLISNWEGLPLSIIEAMRAGLPVIASDVGGVREMIEDGKSGYLVERANAKALERAMEALGSAPQLRKTLGDNARERFQSGFRFDAMFEQTWGVYRDVLGQ